LYEEAKSNFQERIENIKTKKEETEHTYDSMLNFLNDIETSEEPVEEESTIKGVNEPVEVRPSAASVVYRYLFVPLNEIVGKVPVTDTLPSVPVMFPDTLPCGVKLPVDVKPFAAIEPLRYTFVPVNVGVDANAALAPVIALENVIVNVSVDVSTLAFLQNDDVVGVTVTLGLLIVPAGL
jgi:hypothetical protein